MKKYTYVPSGENMHDTGETTLHTDYRSVDGGQSARRLRARARPSIAGNSGTRVPTALGWSIAWYAGYSILVSLQFGNPEQSGRFFYTLAVCVQAVRRAHPDPAGTPGQRRRWYSACGGAAQRRGLTTASAVA